MQAIIRPRYGTVVLADVPDPVPKKGEHLVRVKATSLNKADWHMVTGTPLLARLSRVPVIGLDVAGVIEGGPRDGERILSDVGGSALGGHSTLAITTDRRLATMPDVPFLDAACIPVAGLTALQGLRWGRMNKGARVLVNGASGGVGSFAVQVAKVLGGHVTGLCSSKNLDFVEKLGADEVWDYTDREITGQFDVFFDAAACRPLKEMQQHLTKDGVYVYIGGDMGLMYQVLFTGKLRFGKRLAWGVASANPEDLTTLSDWVEEGQVRVPRTKTIRLPDVPEAILKMGEGRTVGKVAVRVP